MFCGVTAGYGVKKGDTETSCALLQVHLPVKSRDRCVEFLEESEEQGSNDSKLKEDSGGPIFTFDARNRPVQVGITSFGIGCAEKRSPGVYRRVSEYLNWLRSTGAVFNTSNNGIAYKAEISERDLKENLVSNCFPAEAYATIYDGSHKNIDQLEIDDTVLSTVVLGSIHRYSYLPTVYKTQTMTTSNYISKLAENQLSFDQVIFAYQ